MCKRKVEDFRKKLSGDDRYVNVTILVLKMSIVFKCFSVTVYTVPVLQCNKLFPCTYLP